MRLHHLRVEAFGPFNAPVEVDFDTLSSAGLFLLAGPTGAGKSSVLDAVCFALYGQVPGSRATAKQLRCDHAPPHAVPRVTLEATLAGRRFQLVRSPKWERPKKRGSGTTSVNAQVSMSEWREGIWEPLSSRADEVGDLIGRLLGMNLAQFTQVALLPQGEFQTFLRADSEQRRALLQRLFRTGRYDAVESWLRDHRLELTALNTSHRQAVAEVVSRISEAAGVATPELDPADLAGWLDAVMQEAADAHEQAAQAAAEAETGEEQARSAAERARSEFERITRLRAARAEAAELSAREAEHEQAREQLQAARRAVAVLPLHRLVTDAHTAWNAAREAVASATAGWPDDLAAQLDLHTRAAAAAEAALPREARLRTVRHDEAAVTAQREAAATALAQVRAVAAEAPQLVASLRDQAEQARLAAGRVAALTSEREAGLARAEARTRAAELSESLTEARALALQAREQLVTAKEYLVDLQLERRAGLAAELAGGLAAGCACPVCGSAEHPHLARPASDAPGETAEAAARSAVDDAEFVKLTREQRVVELERSVAIHLDRAGDLDTLEADLARVNHELADARELAGTEPGLTARLAEAEASQSTAQVRLNELVAQVGALDERRGGFTTERERLEAEITALLQGTEHATVQALLDEHHGAVEQVRAALAAVEAERVSEQQHTDAVRRLHDTVTSAGFADVEAALQAARSPDDVAALAARVEHHEQRRAAVSELLGEAPDSCPDLPDVGAAETAHAEALTAARAARGLQRVAHTRTERLGGLHTELRTALGAWEPVQAQLDVAAHLSAFVEGRAADNAHRMRLTTYVLAYRLTQVVAAANTRLADMTAGRFALMHTAERGAGQTRGGLGLLVLDNWSGESRDPATLSGGETFVVSLALALGLADVVTYEAGGAALDTLFVDEGFGALDSDTLDAVMDTLDSLREGGRAVGVVSHVTELRHRITTQLHLTPHPSGSTITLHAG